MRDNSKRLSAGSEPMPAVAQQGDMPSFDFSVPTELVELPSKGRYYPPNHPLHNAETIEIKFMTAKDEDILTSPSLLKKGLAVDRFVQNVILDKRINVSSILSGDKNAILVASRINGFGADYKTKVTCPNCAKVSENEFDLSEIKHYYGDDYGDYDIVATENGTFIVALPKSKFKVEVRLLTSKDENELTAQLQNREKNSNLIETNLTDQLRKIIVSINGVTENRIINQAIDVLPAFDSRYLRAAYVKIVPGLDMTQHFECSSCGFAQEVDVPMTIDFFWSRQ